MKLELREEARRLRQEGKSINEIVEATGASKGSVSRWVQDIELTEEQIAALKERQRFHKGANAGARANREKFQEIRLAYQEAGRAKAREGSLLHMAGCMLYWAEGTKSRTQASFANSDPNMVHFFMHFLRKELNVEDSIITIYIHCHTTDPDKIRQIEQYWLCLLKLPYSALRKTIIKKSDTEGTYRILPNGVCSIRISRVELIQHIYGAIQKYGGFENEEWLG